MALTIDLSGRTALVTGASRGIGEAIARFLGEAGASVVVAAGRDTERAEAVAEGIRDAGGAAAAVTGDLLDPGTAALYVTTAREDFGGLDILVNNAGIWEEADIADLLDDDLARMLDLNLGSVFRLCREAVPLLADSRAGRIVNLSSTASLLGEPRHAPYAASKGGMDALTRSLAVELGPRGITVNSVAPGWTRTEMTESELATPEGRALVESVPLRKIATAGDVAWAVAYLASDGAGHVSGVTLPVEGAYRIRR